jgi:hypothetical protein
MLYKNQSQFRMYQNGINYLHKDEILNEDSKIQTNRGCTGALDRWQAGATQGSLNPWQLGRHGASGGRRPTTREERPTLDGADRQKGVAAQDVHNAVEEAAATLADRITTRRHRRRPVNGVGRRQRRRPVNGPSERRWCR